MSVQNQSLNAVSWKVLVLEASIWAQNVSRTHVYGKYQLECVSKLQFLVMYLKNCVLIYYQPIYI